MIRQTEEREMDKRISVIQVVENVVEGQVMKSESVSTKRWASLYKQLNKEQKENGKVTGNDRAFFTLRKDKTLLNITGRVDFEGSLYEIISTRELDRFTMQIICQVKF